jgi:hypothetical protein
MKNEYRILVGKPEAKRPIARRSDRWEVNIKMNVQEIGCEDVDWVHMVQDRVQ